MDISIAEKTFKRLPWPAIGEKAEFTATEEFTAWDAVNGDLSGPSETYPGTLVHKGDKLVLRVYPSHGIILKGGKIIGCY